VKLKKFTLKNGTSTLTLSYATAADYQRFNDIELYTGSVAEALAAGYSFDDTFAAIKDGAITPCDDNTEFMNDSSYKVVIIRGNTNVQVKGTIAYVTTTNTAYVDASTISIREGNSLYASESVTGDTQSATEAIGATETTEDDTQVEETSGSVSEDELLSGAEDDTEVVFDFDEEETTDDHTGSESSQVYTYIIYK
jgi:hypothetical protein